MVVVELFGNRIEIVLGFGATRPGHLAQPLEVRADHVRFRPLAHALEPAKLAIGYFLRVFGQLGVRQTLLQARQIVVTLRVFLAQLTADGAQLLPQDRFSLALAELVAHLTIDLGLELGESSRFSQKLHHFSQAIGYVRQCEKLRRFRRTQEQTTRNSIRKRTRIVFDLGDLLQRAAALLNGADDFTAKRLRQENGFRIIDAGFLDRVSVATPIGITGLD